MYRVMIVDDEPLVRLALNAVIPWHECECVVVAEASDGQEAWNRIVSKQDVDIMIVDMHMPFMNGITLLSKLQEESHVNPPLCIVLSAFTDFDYVRKSFLYGAVDYIMKTELNREHIVPVIEKTVQLLRDRISKKGITEHHEDDRMMKDREAWLRNLLREQQVTDQFAAVQEPLLQSWLLTLSAYQQVMVAVSPDRMLQRSEGDSMADGGMQDHLARILRQGMAMSKLPFECIQMREQEYVILLCLDSSLSYLNLRGNLMEILDALRNMVKNFLNVSLSMGVSDGCSDWRQWNARYDQAQALVQLRFSDGPGRIYYPEHAGRGEKPVLKPWDFTKLMDLMNAGDARWLQLLREGFQQLNELPHVTKESCSSRYDELLWHLGVSLHAKGMNWTHVLAPHQKVYEVLEQFLFREELHEWLVKLAQRTVEVLNPDSIHVDNNPQRLVERVRQYVDKNFNNVITLGQVSEWAKVTESHLSKQFLKETGEHFSEYVTKLRLTEAARLMQSDRKMYEISDMVGYENPEHFSRVFKRYMGMSPQKYRQLVLKNKG